MTLRDLDRERRIRAMYDEGANLRQCGAAFGLSHERIRQILTRAGHPVRAHGRNTTKQQRGEKRDKLIALSRQYEAERA